MRELVEAFIEANISDTEAVKFLYYFLNRLEQSFYYSKSERLSIAEVISKIDRTVSL